MPRMYCGSWIVCAALLAPSGSANVSVTPSKVVELGTHGDAFGVDELIGETAVILVRPKGETCVLRFPIRVGDSLHPHIRH